jgi:hypothetical protein
MLSLYNWRVSQQQHQWLYQQCRSATAAADDVDAQRDTHWNNIATTVVSIVLEQVPFSIWTGPLHVEHLYRTTLTERRPERPSRHSSVSNL